MKLGFLYLDGDIIFLKWNNKKIHKTESIIKSHLKQNFFADPHFTHTHVKSYHHY